MSSDKRTLGGSAATRGREQALAEAFVTLADTLVDDYDVVDLLDRLASASVEVLGVDAAGLLLKDQNGSLAVIASSSEESRLLEIFQLQSDEGPCLDCVRTGAEVTSDNLEADQARWPTFVPAALDAGFRAVDAVPLRLRDQTIGGLNLFGGRAQGLTGPDRQLAQALADVATIGILQQRAAHRSSMLAEHLQYALNSRIAIEQAKGVLAERNNIGMDVAFNALRNFARNNNLKLADVAQAVVRGGVDPRVVMAPAERPRGRR
jgi:transcriptional regulator with GAF, ATPase, and Fis domain